MPSPPLVAAPAMELNTAASSQNALDSFHVQLLRLAEAHEHELQQLRLKLMTGEPENSKLKAQETAEASANSHDEAAISQDENTQGKDNLAGADFELHPEWTSKPVKNFASHFHGSVSGGLDSVISSRKIKTQEATQGCIMVPGSRKRVVWDIMCLLLLAFDLVWIPMQVFEPPPSIVIDVLNWATLVYWTLDIPATFFTAVHVREGVFVRKFDTIARRYLKSWFVVDIFVVGLDWAIFVYSNQAKAAGLLRISKLARVAGIARIVRLVRLGKILQLSYTLQDSISSEVVTIVLGICTNVFVLITVNHIMACSWYLIGSYGEGDSHWVDFYGMRERSFGDRYLHSLHWSLTQFTPAGMHISPRNPWERLFNVLLILMAMVGFSTFVSSITASMTEIRRLQGSKLTKAFRLRKFLKANHISTDLSVRVIRYIDLAQKFHTKTLSRTQVEHLQLLSGPLNIELQKELFAPKLTGHPFFAEYAASDAAMSHMCFAAVSKEMLSKDDALFQTFGECSRMYLLTSGTLFYHRPHGVKWDAHKRNLRNRRRIVLVHAGQWFCEASLWVPWANRGSAGALIESELVVIDSPKFRKVTLDFWDAFQSAKTYAHIFLKQITETRQRHGTAWDIPRETLFPDVYGSPLSDRVGEEEETKAFRQIKSAELLQALLQESESEEETEGDTDAACELLYP